MSLVVAIPFGIASAVVYGSSIVVQHRVAQQTAAEQGADGGEPTARSLVQILKHPLFLLAMAGDFIGFLLQIVALSTGAVVIIQPLVVLMLPVALVVSSLSGGPRPVLGDYLGVAGVIGGLAVFLSLVGEPVGEHVPRPRVLAVAVVLVLVVGLVLTLTAAASPRILKGAGYGAVAGFYFGTLAVLVDAASEQVSVHGWHGLFVSPRGLVPLGGILVLGAGGIVLTQLSFQVGALSATLPANLAADPFVGVLLGVVLLREHIPHSVAHVVAYLACLGVVVAGTIRLAGEEQTGGRDPAGSTA